MKPCHAITLYQLHLPSEVRVFQYISGPTYAGRDAVVMDSVLIEDDVSTYCRGYYFLDRWLSVFITFNEQLELRPEPDYDFPFAFNCDITTPHYCQERSIFTTDLYLDVLVGADGITYQLEDSEDLQKAFDASLFGRRWFDNARREADWLVDTLEGGRFLDFLNEVEPFPNKKSVNVQSRMRKCLIDQTDFEYNPQYPRYE
ncbi:hypothetical protein ACFL6S_27875 [Candidatus Poribacteria bacterium]